MFFKTSINGAYLHLDSRYAPIVAFSQLCQKFLLEPSSLLETCIFKLSQTFIGFTHQCIHTFTLWTCPRHAMLLPSLPPPGTRMATPCRDTLPQQSAS